MVDPLFQKKSGDSLVAKNIRRPKEPILIVEDKIENQTLLVGICNRIGVATETADNGQIALEMMQKKPYSLFLVDLMMPVMDGKTFIEQAKRIDPNAVFIVQTAVDQTDQIIEVMKLGVYDYLLKPLHVEIVSDRLEKSLEYVYLKRMEKILESEESKELKDQLEWLNYKESNRKARETNSDIHSILNLRTTLSQGSGIGAITTLIDSLDKGKKTDNDTVSINKDFWELLCENNKHAKSMIRGLNIAVNIIQNNSPLVSGLSDVILSILPETAKKYENEIEEKQIKVNYPVVKNTVNLSFNKELLSLVIDELFINGLKYSQPKSNFDIFVTFVDGYFCLSLKNNMLDDDYAKQIPLEEKRLIQPFYRIHPPVESFYSKEPFSLGLGLTMVDFIMQKHHGMFFIRNAVDHTSEEVSNCVITEIFLPIQNN
ncbi:response regulator [Leptospira sp. 96542]|nr:response regulator [Leptospira sp. 96542]